MSEELLPQGECEVCGLPGIVGMSCTDPDCMGTVIGLQVTKKDATLADDETEDAGDGRYDKDLLDDDSVVSLEDLAEDEDTKESTDTSDDAQL